MDVKMAGDGMPKWQGFFQFGCQNGRLPKWRGGIAT